MEKSNSKILTVSFVVTALLAALVTRVLFETLAASFGSVARLYGMESLKHGLPVAMGMVIFFVLQFNKTILVWADEVVTEIRKIVWPTRKDVTAMTIVCIVMLFIAGIILGLFDFLSRSLIGVVLGGA